MKIILQSKANSFILNGMEYQKGAVPVNHSVEGISINQNSAQLSEIECDGSVFGTIAELNTWISANLFKSGGGSTGEGVQSVTGNIVNNTDPKNPIISIDGGSDKKIVGFDNEGNPVAMMINIKQLTDVGGFPSFANGVLMATAMDPETETGLILFGEFSTTTPKAGTFPSYGTGGVLPVGNGVADGDAINLGQLIPILNGRFNSMRIVNVTATRNFALTDLGINSILRCHGTVSTLTIPLDSTLNFPIGSIIKIVSTSSTTTIASASGVDLVSDNGDFVLSGNKSATLVKMANNSWFLSMGL